MQIQVVIKSVLGFLGFLGFWDSPHYARHMKFRQKVAYAEKDLNFEIRNQLNSYLTIIIKLKRYRKIQTL